MTTFHIKEIRQLVLLGLFLAIAPLVFFPRNFGLSLGLNPFFIFLFELFWYAVALSLLLSPPLFASVMLISLLTFVFRLTLGFAFGLFLFIMFPLGLGKALSFGILNYSPAHLFQAFLLPFIVKHSLGDGLKNLWRLKRPKLSLTEQTDTEVDQPIKKALIEKDMKEKSLQKSKEVSLEVTLEDAINYLKEYPGVEGVLLVDSDGLVVAKKLLSGLDEEKLAPFGVTFREVNTKLLQRLDEDKIDKIQILSDKLWICLTSIGDFCLLTLADRHTDELLNIRISKTKESIKKYLEKRYDQMILSSEEEEYVSDLRGA